MQSMPARPADLIVENPAQVVTCEQGTGEGTTGVIEQGALAASGERVVWVGPASRLVEDVALKPGGQRLDARGRVVLPGLVGLQRRAIRAR